MKKKTLEVEIMECLEERWFDWDDAPIAGFVPGDHIWLSGQNGWDVYIPITEKGLSDDPISSIVHWAIERKLFPVEAGKDYVRIGGILDRLSTGESRALTVRFTPDLSNFDIHWENPVDIELRGGNVTFSTPDVPFEKVEIAWTKFVRAARERPQEEKALLLANTWTDSDLSAVRTLGKKTPEFKAVAKLLRKFGEVEIRNNPLDGVGRKMFL